MKDVTKQNNKAMMKPCALNPRRTFLRPSHHPSSCLWFRDVSALGPLRSGETKAQQDVCFDCHKATGINGHRSPPHNNKRHRCTAAQESHPASPGVLHQLLLFKALPIHWMHVQLKPS